MLRIPSPVCYSPAERVELDAMLHSDQISTVIMTREYIVKAVLVFIVKP